MQFVTGSSKVPIEGFDKLQGMNVIEPFTINRILALALMGLINNN
jgi:hypothetical protein